MKPSSVCFAPPPPHTFPINFHSMSYFLKAVKAAFVAELIVETAAERPVKWLKHRNEQIEFYLG